MVRWWAVHSVASTVEWKAGVMVDWTVACLVAWKVESKDVARAGTKADDWDGPLAAVSADVRAD